MAGLPDAQPAFDAMTSLVKRMRALPATQPDRQECMRLVADLHVIAGMALWCREAAVDLATKTQPRVTFREMEQVTGVDDSTLHSRVRNWRASKVEGGEE